MTDVQKPAAMLTLPLLQATRLKGRLSAEVAAACTGADKAGVSNELDKLAAAGMLSTSGTGYQLTADGRSRLDELLSEERSSVDAGSLRQCYEDFDQHNTTLKSIITSWQIKDDGTPNDHSDSSYDEVVVQRLLELHRAFSVLLARIVDAAPRLTPFIARFDHGVSRLLQGDTSYVARPMLDSYHTVWFELHEELIGMLGLSRSAEAAAGRAT